MERSIHSSDLAQSAYGARSLETKHPGVLRFLNEGATVLDVGCNVGTITVGIAQAVRPGKVVGVDVEESSLEKARELATKEGVLNLEFRVASAYDLKFDDATFDIVFSAAVLSWLADPIAALREYRRVTKPGGKVIVPMGDFGSWVFYPPRPNFIRLLEAADKCLSDPSDPENYWHPFLGRYGRRLFQEAEFANIGVEPGVGSIQSPAYGPRGFTDPKAYELDGPFGQYWRKLIEIGAIEPGLLQGAIDELEEWKQNPSSLGISASIIVWGEA